MTIHSERTTAPAAGQIQPVHPSLVVRIVLRPMTKILNPLIVKLAGKPRFAMAAQIRHVGRRSGRAYVTPVSARRAGEVVIIPLTFGNQSDWSRNVLAAGRCSLLLDGVDYDAGAPALLSPQEVRPYLRPAFSPVERLSLRMLGIKQFMRLDLVPASS